MEEVEILVMDTATRKSYLENGCDPCCHACGKLIAVGDKYTIKVFGEVVSYDRMNIVIRGTACPTCTESGRGWSEEEEMQMLERLARVRKPDAEERAKMDVPKTAPAEEDVPQQEDVPIHRGCFFLEDGTPF